MKKSKRNLKEFGKQVSGPEGDVAIYVSNLTIQFGDKKIVDDVSFQIKKGEINGFLGISGAGKTTIIRVLTCQIKKKYWKGEVFINGLSPAKSTDKAKILGSIGYVPQLEEANIYYDLTPMQNVEIFASTFGLNKKDALTRAEELFKILDVPKDTWKNKTMSMSGGEKKRLSVALGMINNPEILFLDEPTTGVDASKRFDILNYLKGINQKFGTTLLLITHDLEASNICDTVAILAGGKLIEFGSPIKFINSLPSNGRIIRIRIKELDRAIIEKIESFEFVAVVSRVGNDTVEVFIQNYEENFSNLITSLVESGIYIEEVSQDKSSFKRYFQLRIKSKEFFDTDDVEMENKLLEELQL